MRWSAEKLRWVSLGGALLLAGVVAAFFGLANYRAGKVWQRILARNGVNLVQESNSITYSQSVRGRTVFTLHAAKSVPHGKGQYTLHDAVLILYGKDGRNDRISGNQFEYDQSQGILHALGEVHMDLEAPQAAGSHARPVPATGLTFTPDDQTAEDPGLIHVRTSGLVYTRKGGVASTKEMAEFRYQGLTCTSRGAEFDSGQNVLRLLADVRMTGTLRDAPFTATAIQAELNRTADTADLREPRMESGERSARAAHALLHLRKDGSLEAGDADGAVQLVSRTQTVSAPRLHADFAGEDRLHHALLSGGVTFADTDTARPANGSAQMLDLSMTPQGTLSTAAGQGQVALLVKQTGAAGAPETRQMRAQTATASFVPVGAGSKKAVLHVLKMEGAASFEAESEAKAHGGQQPTATRVSADELTTTFVSGKGENPEPQRMQAAGHTQLQQSGAEGQHQVSTGELLDVSFAQRLGGAANGGAVEVSSALQTGHVVLHSWPAGKPGQTAEIATPATGYAHQALFQAAEGTLTLTGAGGGRAEVDDGGTQLQAPKIVLHQGSGDGEATGGVTASMAGNGGSPATHVLASRAVLFHTSEVSEFYGEGGHPAQMWQGESQVQAAKILLDGQHHTMAARPASAGGVVSAVFATEGNGQRPAPGHAAAATQASAGPGRRSGTGTGEISGSKMPEASRDAVQVRAAAMDYNDAQHEATFQGDVQMQGAAGEITGRHAAAFLAAPVQPAAGAAAPPAGGRAAAPNMGGRLQRLVVIGDVRVTQPGRTGVGEQLTYTAASNTFVLTGTPGAPPRLHDAQQGTISGATLLFGAGDSSIVVAGTHAPGNQGKPTRVHTETDIKQ